MKNYFNAKERTEHIIMLASQENIEQFSKSSALMPEEKRKLTTALKAIKDFNLMVYERFGDAYMRKIARTMQDNELRLVGKGLNYTESISHAATEDLAPKINDLRMLHCLDCEKCDYKNCAVYSICVACDVEISNEGRTCPFGI